MQALAFAMAFAGGGALAVDLEPGGRTAQAVGIFGLTFLSMNGVAPASVETMAARIGWAGAFASAGLGALVCAALATRHRTALPSCVISDPAIAPGRVLEHRRLIP